MKEVWKDIPGYEGFYKASSLGEIKSLERTCSHCRGGSRLVPEKIRKGTKNPKGYKMVFLSKEGKRINYLVHRLVLFAFYGHPTEGLTCNHKDGNKTNNSIKNLEWISHSENIQHSIKVLKNFPLGEKHYKSKLTRNDVLEIRELSRHGFSQSEIGRGYGVTSSMILNIQKIRSWKHV